MKILRIIFVVLALDFLNSCFLIEEMISGCSHQKMERDLYQEAHPWLKNAKGSLTPVRLGWLVPYDEPSTDLCYIKGFEIPTTDPWIVSKVAIMALFAGALLYLLRLYSNENENNKTEEDEEQEICVRVSLNVSEGSGMKLRKKAKTVVTRNGFANVTLSV